jgi:serine/threonine protein kinase/tetratricopeptide (TPR) repeat protein
MINGRYEIIEKIGEGRSSVFLCFDRESFNQKIALKVFTNSKDAQDLTSFRNEFRNLKNFEHPNIINAIEEGTVLESSYENISPGYKFFTLEYFPGKDLLSISDYSENDLTEIIVQISAVLFYLHQSNFIYYDLKPENILISHSNSKPLIKLIDFGLARHINKLTDNNIIGTAEFIAPELLRREVHDHRVDLYSFGMLLYRMIYNKFPFDNKNEIEIYKAHLEKEYEFPDSGYSPGIINIVKKLLSKDPSNRYLNSVQIIHEINQELIKVFSENWVPAKIFIDRTDDHSILINYLNDKSSSEIFSVKGPEGAGKSFLLNKIYSEFNEAVLINYNKAKSGIDFIKEFLIKILYNESIFYSITKDLRNKFKVLIDTPPEDIIEQIKALFSQISQDCNFFILFDNFNEIDELTHDVVKNIIPILQVNKRKFILAENPDVRILSADISELHEINLTSFTESDLNEFLQKSYFKEFPHDEVKKIILLYADLLPGNIVGFLRDILLLGILEYHNDGIKFFVNKNTNNLLQGSHEEIYELRVSSLSDVESSAIELISIFDISIDQDAAAILLDKSSQEMEIIVSSLLNKNIILPVHLRNILDFSSSGLKNYIYNRIKDKKQLHYKTALKIKHDIKNFNRVELARQFELSDKFKESYEAIKEELIAAEKISAYSYKKKILQKYLGFSVGNEFKSEIKSDLVFVLYNLSEFVDAEILINELLVQEYPADKKDELLILKGSCLIGSGNIEAGKNLLNQLINKIDNKDKRLKLLAEVASAEYELNNYNETAQICQQIINDNRANEIQKGKCFNLLGLISVFKDNDLNNALNNFELAATYYNDKNLNYKVAQLEKNIGNLYFLKGEHNKAEEYWNKSLDLTLSIGNLEHEAQLLMGFGVYYFDKLNFEKAHEYYNRALSIFVSLGSSSGQGLVKYNLGEIYLLTCEFEKSIESIENSVKIFNNLKNLNEEMESLFLLGKLYFTIGDEQNLNMVIGVMKEKIIDEKIVDKHKINYNLLKLLYSISYRNVEDQMEPFRIIKNQYRELDDKNNFFFVAVQLIKLSIKLGYYDEAASELEDDTFLAICALNKLYNSEKNYMFAILSTNKNSYGNPIDYLLEAFKYISESSITELSWKVLYRLAEIYYERGNYSKSEEFNTFAISVLNFILNNIKNEKIKSIVAESSERKEVYQNLLIMQKKY